MFSDPQSMPIKKKFFYLIDETSTSTKRNQHMLVKSSDEYLKPFLDIALVVKTLN